MGLSLPFIEGLIRERIYRGLGDDVLLIGRQTIYFTPQEILELLNEHHIDTGGIKVGDIEIDRRTVNRPAEYESKELISDFALLGLLGVPKVLALDHSDYEGAEIIHDLNKPVPSHLRGCADFIVDGSTLDNVFNAALVLKNFADLLKPGGRLLTGNLYSNHSFPYSMVTPLWLLDYFVMNGFVDCKVYILVSTASGTDAFTIDLDCLQDPARSVSAFVSPHYMATFAFAEKGADSTTDVSPSQQHYRSAEEWVVYRRNLKRIRQSTRQHLLRSTGNISLFEVAGGHLFIANDFTARDPQTEIKLSSLSSLQAENAKLSNQNATLEARAFEAERTVQALQAENAKLSNQNAALEARAFEAKRTVQDMLASTSWRITSPLRAIKKLLP